MISTESLIPYLIFAILTSHAQSQEDFLAAALNICSPSHSGLSKVLLAVSLVTRLISNFEI